MDFLNIFKKSMTQLPIMLSIAIYGLTRSKEIVKMLFDAGVGISMESIDIILDTWAYNDIEQHSICPEEIAEGIPGTAIIDNDDFKDDDLTGGTTSHRTNMMFVQPEKYIDKKEGDATNLKRCSRGMLKEIAMKENNIKPYVTIERGEPAKFEEIEVDPPNTSSIRKKLFAHAIVRTDESGDDILPENQTIGAFTGFMNSLSNAEDRSKPY